MLRQAMSHPQMQWLHNTSHVSDMGLGELSQSPRALCTRMVHRFINGICDEVKESSWIENGRKPWFLRHLRMEIFQWMLRELLVD